MLFKDVKIVYDILITIPISIDFRASVITGITMLIVLVFIFIYFWIQRNKKQGKFSWCVGHTVWLINYTETNKK